MDELEQLTLVSVMVVMMLLMMVVHLCSVSNVSIQDMFVSRVSKTEVLVVASVVLVYGESRWVWTPGDQLRMIPGNGLSCSERQGESVWDVMSPLLWLPVVVLDGPLYPRVFVVCHSNCVGSDRKAGVARQRAWQIDRQAGSSSSSTLSRDQLMPKYRFSQVWAWQCRQQRRRWEVEGQSNSSHNVLRNSGFDGNNRVHCDVTLFSPM